MNCGNRGFGFFGPQLSAPGGVYYADAGGLVTADAARFRWDSVNKRLGVGTASPSYQLDVKGADSATDGVICTTSSYANIPNPGSITQSCVFNPRGFNLCTDGVTLSAGYQPTLGVAAAVGRINVPAASFKNTLGPALLIEAGGVGIGTSSLAGYVLNIHAASAAVRFQSDTGTNPTYFVVNNGGGDLIFGVEGSAGGALFAGTAAYAGVLGHDAVEPLHFATNNTVRVTIDSAGNTGLATTAPASLLDLFAGTLTCSANSTTMKRAQADLVPSWVDSTDATRKAHLILNAYDTAARECMRIEATGSAAAVGFLGATAATRQTSGANLTNNVTSGGTTDQIDDFTNLTVYATDAAAIRNDIYQLARKVKQLNDALRLYGLLT